MRICFYSTDPKVGEIGSVLEGVDVSYASSLDEVQSSINSSQDKLLLFIDLDGNKAEAELINSTFYEDSKVIRLIVTENTPVAELKKHQLSEVSAYGYIRKPLSGQLIASLVNNFEMADYVEENNLLNEGDEAAEDVELTFVGVKVPDLNKAPVEEETDEGDDVFEATPMQIPKESNDEDVDNLLEFGSGASDKEDKTVSGINDDSLEEVNLTHNETKVLEMHGVLNENWKVTYESELNKKIQAKFDRVFSMGASGLPDFQVEEPTPELDNDFEESTGQADVSAISLDLGEEELSSPSIDLSDQDYLEESRKQDIISPSPDSADSTGDFDIKEMMATDNAQEGSEKNIPQLQQETSQNNEVSMTDHDDEDDILDFNIPDVDEDSDKSKESEKVNEVEAVKTDVNADIDEENEELGFSIDEDIDEEEGDSESELVTDLETNVDEELIASGDDGDELDLGDDGDELDLGDDGDELDLGDDIEISADAGVNDELDLDDMDLNLSEVDGEASNTPIDSGDDLDLDNMNDEMDLDETNQDSIGEMDLNAIDEGINEFDSLEVTDDETREFENLLNADEETNEIESLEASDEETNEFETLQVSDEDETAEIANLEGVLEEENDENDDEATVATMLFQNTNLVEENSNEINSPEEASEESDDVDLASLIEEDEEDEEKHGFNLDEKIEEDDGLTETLLADSEENEADATETLLSSSVSDDEITQQTVMLDPAVEEVGSNFTPVSGDKTIEITPIEKRVASAYNEDELMRLQATIRQLREERDGLLKDISDLKTEKKLQDQENLGLKAELDEVKIELTIMKKRHQDEIEEMNYRTRLSDEKKAIAEEKSRQMQKEFDRLSQKVRIDFNQVKQREKELESQLELVSMDSESQVRSRDMKILELKRKIDQLEFNMENSAIKESKAREDKVKIEEKLAKIMKTLRGSIQVLEDDLELDEELIEKIKKA